MFSFIISNPIHQWHCDIVHIWRLQMRLLPSASKHAHCIFTLSAAALDAASNVFLVSFRYWLTFCRLLAKTSLTFFRAALLSLSKVFIATSMFLVSCETVGFTCTSAAAFLTTFLAVVVVVVVVEDAAMPWLCRTAMRSSSSSCIICV